MSVFLPPGILSGVISAAASLINELLDGQHYTFWFLMENLWWPGLNLLHAEYLQKGTTFF